MLISSGISARNYQEIASQKISTLGIRNISGYANHVKEQKEPKAKLKFKKIKRTDFLTAPEGLPEEYYSNDRNKAPFLNGVMQHLNLLRGKDNCRNFFMAGITYEGDTPKYFNETYLITDIISPIRHRGAGTEAIQGLVEKSMLDEDTCGRVILYLNQISKEDTSFQFFYKLGFRFVKENLNTAAQKAIIQNNMQMQIEPSYMYLPKENLPKLLRYRHLF